MIRNRWLNQHLTDLCTIVSGAIAELISDNYDGKRGLILGYPQVLLISPICVLLSILAWMLTMQVVVPGAEAPTTYTLMSGAVLEDYELVSGDLKANGASRVWRASALGLLVCIVVYSAIGIRSRTLLSESQLPKSARRGRSRRVTFKTGVFCALPFLLAICIGILTGCVLPQDVRVQILERAYITNDMHMMLSPGMLISLIWASAGYMIVAGVYFSWNTSLATYSIEQLCDGDVRGLEKMQRVSRYLNLVLVIGAVGPVIGVVEVVSLAHLASSLIIAHESVREALIASGHGSALEIGFLFTMIQISVYVPAYLICHRRADRLVCNYFKTKETARGKSLMTLARYAEEHEKLMTSLGFPSQTQSSVATRAIAIASPVIAAVGSNLINVPSF